MNIFHLSLSDMVFQIPTLKRSLTFTVPIIFMCGASWLKFVHRKRLVMPKREDGVPKELKGNIDQLFLVHMFLIILVNHIDFNQHLRCFSYNTMNAEFSYHRGIVSFYYKFSYEILTSMIR